MTKQNKFLISIFCVLKLALHLIADSHSGFQGDELLHVETGNHLAFGYMEFPPLIGVVACIQNSFNSNSIYIHHLFTHVSSILILIYTAKITLTLGGKNKALFLVLLSILIAPAFGRTQQLFQPVVFGQLFWVLSFYHLLCYSKYLEKKNLLYLTLLSVTGVLFKYDLLFFILGLSSLLFYKRTRTALFKQKFWLYIAAGIVLVLPNLYWQYANHFPAIQMFSRLYETQLVAVSRWENIKNIVLAMNPVSSILVLPAIVCIFKYYKAGQYKPALISIAISFLLLLCCNGKAYYFFPILLTILPFGGVFWEQSIDNNKEWAYYPIFMILVLGSVLIPFGMPVYSFTKMLSSIQKYETQQVEGGKYLVRYDEYYSKEKWNTTLRAVKNIYQSLPKNEQQKCLLWGKHYAQAGALTLLGSAYNLPNTFSYHGSFYSWSPTGTMPNTVIAVSYEVGPFFKPYFEKVTLVKSIYNPYADNEEELYQNIYLCRKPKQDFKKMTVLFSERIFE